MVIIKISRIYVCIMGTAQSVTINCAQRIFTVKPQMSASKSLLGRLSVKLLCC